MGLSSTAAEPVAGKDSAVSLEPSPSIAAGNGAGAASPVVPEPWNPTAGTASGSLFAAQKRMQEDKAAEAKSDAETLEASLDSTRHSFVV